MRQFWWWRDARLPLLLKGHASDARLVRFRIGSGLSVSGEGGGDVDVGSLIDAAQSWTKDIEGAGWKSDAGAGLEWRIASRGWVRVDLAIPFQPSPGADRARVYATVRLPF